MEFIWILLIGSTMTAAAPEAHTFASRQALVEFALKQDLSQTQIKMVKGVEVTFTVEDKPAPQVKPCLLCEKYYGICSFDGDQASLVCYRRVPAPSSGVREFVWCENHMAHARELHGVK